MIMYHGTIKGYADSIIRDGLKPMPENAFHVNNIPIPINDGIYLTSDKGLATQFAYTRAMYSQVEAGEVFDWLSGWGKNREGQPKANVDTTPVIVELDIPDTSRLELDPDYIGRDIAYRCHCLIPANQVKAVIPIPNGGSLYDIS